MKLEPSDQGSLISLPPFPVLRDLLNLDELFLNGNPAPFPNTWDELVGRAKQVNIDAAGAWLGLNYRPEQAWDLVAGKIGDRAAATAAILSAAVDLLRPFDAEPQRIFIDIANKPVGAARILSYAMRLVHPFDPLHRDIFVDISRDTEVLKRFHLDKACASFLDELRNLRHPAPPYAIDGLPSAADIHACLLLIDPDYEPPSEEAGWLRIFRTARHDLSIDYDIPAEIWNQLRRCFRNHGAAVAVVISGAMVATGASRDWASPMRRFCSSLSMTGHDLTRIMRDLVESSPRPPAPTTTATEKSHDRT